MDRSAKSFFAVTLSVVAFLMITNLVINADSVESPSSTATLIVLAGAVLFWVWLWLDLRPRPTIEAPEEPGADLQVPQLQAKEWVIAHPSARTLPAGGAAAEAHAAPLPFEPVAPVMPAGEEHGEIPDDEAAPVMDEITPEMVVGEPQQPHLDLVEVPVTETTVVLPDASSPAAQKVDEHPGMAETAIPGGVAATDEVPSSAAETVTETATNAPVPPPAEVPASGAASQAAAAEEIIPVPASSVSAVDEEAPFTEAEVQSQREAPLDDTPAALAAAGSESPALSHLPDVSVAPVAAPITLDDFTKIEGIGPKYNQVLHEGGLATYAQLAGATPEQLTEIMHNAGYTRLLASLDTWAEQAGYLAAGDQEGLRTFQGTLTGGRRPGTGDD